MHIIQSSYPNGAELPTSRIVVCDLHFHPHDILKQGERRVLASDAVPNISYVFGVFE